MKENIMICLKMGDVTKTIGSANTELRYLWRVLRKGLRLYLNILFVTPWIPAHWDAEGDWKPGHWSIEGDLMRAIWIKRWAELSKAIDGGTDLTHATVWKIVFTWRGFVRLWPRNMKACRVQLPNANWHFHVFQRRQNQSLGLLGDESQLWILPGTPAEAVSCMIWRE